MLRRALASERRLAWAIFGADAVWCAALLLVPFLLAPGTVTGLEGRENHVDHLDLWLSLPVVPAMVYGVGDLLCHQKDWRSFHLNGNALAVDERMAAIFFTAAFALAWGASRASPSVFITDALRSLAPASLRRRFPADRAATARRIGVLVVVALAPAAADVLWENLLGRESTMPVRVATGAVAGVAGGLVLAAATLSVDAFARILWRDALEHRVARRWPRAAERVSQYMAVRDSGKGSL